MGKTCKEKVAAYFKVKWWYLTGRIETSLSGLPVSGPTLKTGTLTYEGGGGGGGASPLTEMFGTTQN
jgi:hypothetical protein